ncbi:MAG: orotate phosphoribosyltransferase [Lachnospiraceae bacterium]|nr:orotate phosphoribosyltransferase [Lachnospiraceae bacterium]MDD7027885.1 orotate phosphoribosyltransferase [Lachnospiraceae bacterium]MDY5699945.1 orotate phosphoribosyltransferase [Lachnospiraceae bacterium]
MQDMIKISSKQHPNVILKAIPGHFVTPNSHVNYYLDMTTLKTRLSEASAAARELSAQIAVSTIVDTIVCIDGCEIIGAFLADELTRAGIYSMNAHKTIYIITPEFVSTGQLVFRENFLPMIKGKNVLLLLASATTGQTIVKATQALRYYGASISGISAVFSAANSMMGIPIRSLFTIADLPDYKAYDPEGCSLCKNNQPIDAFANAFGYSRIE